MVVRANRVDHSIGGHISTYASAATLFEVGFNHFFRGRTDEFEGDTVYLQGHASPGVYARAFLEGRLSMKQLENFRRELREGGGLSSYPHPWLMPDFWEFPTVSMGLSPLMAIYQARFNRYLEDRSLKPRTDAKVWAFLGDGETDEPETLGAITLASRENLDNIIFVINCNLQRLDGPVRGNGKIVQELEAAFRGAGWNCIKVLWGSDWDPLFERDTDGLLAKRLGEMVDGETQKISVESGAYVRQHVFGGDPRLLKMVEDLPDEALRTMRQGGHDPRKVYAAYKAAFDHKGSPTVILARTIKGYGLGESGEGRNITHQQKKLNEEELREFRSRFGIPISDEQLAETPFYLPPEDSREIQYLRARRQALGGYVPARKVRSKPLVADHDALFREFLTGSEGREVSTTMAFVGMLRQMLRDPEIGKVVVPIVPDEARTFGMESLFRQVGIYSSRGQLYEPVDVHTLLYYKEAKDGQILEEGITEAGSMASFIAAGSAYATHGINTIPFFIYYSMFGLQRISDFIWAAADMRCRGFMLGGTAGRTTLAGEGLQHQDGNSHVLALPIPTMRAYDPAFAYEIAVIIQDGIRRMYKDGENIFYYITVMNEPYAMPAMPAGVAGRNSQGHVQVPRVGNEELEIARATLRQRRHPARGLEGAGNFGRKIRRVRGRVERHELQGALHRRDRYGALEPAAFGRKTARAVCFRNASRIRTACWLRLRIISRRCPISSAGGHRGVLPRSEPTGLAAAKAARRFGTFSKWMRDSLRSPRCMNCFAKEKSSRRSCKKPSRSSKSTLTSRIRSSHKKYGRRRTPARTGEIKEARTYRRCGADPPRLQDSGLPAAPRRYARACNGNSRAAKSNPAKSRRKPWRANFAKNSELRPRSAGNFFARGIATAKFGRNSS